MNDNLQKVTQMLGLINSLIPIGMQLGETLVGLIKGAIDAGTADQATLDEAKAKVAQFRAATKDAGDFIANWQATHPPTT